MKRLLELLGVPLQPYSPKDDPLKLSQILLQESKVTGRSGEVIFDPIEWTIPDEWVKDKELAERVKSRKVIRKRPGVKEEGHDRKKVKCNEGQGIVDERKDLDIVILCHKNGDALKEESNIKEEEEDDEDEDDDDDDDDDDEEEEEEEEEEEVIREEMDTLENTEDKESVIKSERENGIKEEEIKSETKEEKTKEEIQDKAINKDKANGEVKNERKEEIKIEDDKIDQNKVYSNGDTEVIKSGVTKEKRSKENEDDLGT